MSAMEQSPRPFHRHTPLRLRRYLSVRESLPEVYHREIGGTKGLFRLLFCLRQHAVQLALPCSLRLKNYLNKGRGGTMQQVVPVV